MKNYQGFLLMMLMICLLAFCGAALADTLEDNIYALIVADSFDAQLALLDKIAVENSAELANGYWDIGLTVNAAPGFPAGIIPDDWEKMVYTETDSLPEVMRGHKFIALHCAGNWQPELAGDLLARFPAAMRAASLEEAEYALIVHYHYVPSGYKYIPSASSSHCDYEAYAVNLKTGETTRFWTERSFAKHSGKAGQLNGELFSQRQIWIRLRRQIYAEMRQTQADGTVLIFGKTCDYCFLKGFEGELTTLDMPAKVEGQLVTEIMDHCFSDNTTLTTVYLPEGLRFISSQAFKNCTGIKSIQMPDTLEYIAWEAFMGCSNLARVVLGEGLTELSMSVFEGCNNLARCYVPASLTSGLSEAKISKKAVIYAPENSYVLQWAAENGYEYVVCNHPDDMPDAE